MAHTDPIDLKQRHRELSGNPREGEAIKLRQSIRINTLKVKKKGIPERMNEQDIVARLKKRGVKLEKIPFLKHGYWTEAPFSLAGTEEHLLGLFYLQEAAAQMPVEWMALKTDESALVIDACASPGGKTTQIAQEMENEGIIVALDLGRKVDALRNNLERMGASNTIVYNQDARFFELPKNYAADALLLDVPCSGNYAIEKEWYKKRTIEDIRNCSRLQKEIVRGAIRNVKKGSAVVYSTCSLEPEEDEEVLAWMEKELSVTKQRMEKKWPGKDKMQGMFVAGFAQDESSASIKKTDSI